MKKSFLIFISTVFFLVANSVLYAENKNDSKKKENEEEIVIEEEEIIEEEIEERSRRYSRLKAKKTGSTRCSP